MTMVIVGKADRNRTVEEVMGESARTGARYIDLATGNLIALFDDKKPTEEKLVKKKSKKKMT